MLRGVTIEPCPLFSDDEEMEFRRSRPVKQRTTVLFPGRRYHSATMRLRNRALIAAVLTLGIALLPSTALAQGDDAIADPNSPSGEEYAVPLDEARRDDGSSLGGGGPGGGGPGGSDSAELQANGTTLFGTGVSKRGGAAGSKRDNGANAGSRSAEGREQQGAALSGPRTPASLPPPVPSRGEGASSSWGLGGLTLLVIGGGALVGVAARRVQRLRSAGT